MPIYSPVVVSGPPEQKPRSYWTEYPIVPPERPSYVFVGLAPLVREAAERIGLDPSDPETARVLQKTNASWHAGQLQTGLGQIADLAMRERKGLAARGTCDDKVAGLVGIRNGLSALIAAADDAIVTVCAANDIAIPSECLPEQAGPAYASEDEAAERIGLLESLASALTTDPSTPNHTVSETSDAPDDQSVGGGPGEHDDLGPGESR